MAVTALPPYVELAAQDLLAAAEQAGADAAAGRSRPYRAVRALSSMALLFMAFEAWINHELTLRVLFSGQGEPDARDRGMLELLQHGGLAQKARRLPRYAGGIAFGPQEHPELELIVLIRHELMHHLPSSNARDELNRLDALEGRDLLITASSGPVEYMPHQRLASYDLAWWAWSTVRTVVEAIEAARPRTELTSEGLHNFDLPRQWGIPAPATIAAR